MTMEEEMKPDVMTAELLAALVKMTAIEAAQFGPLTLVCWLSLRKEDGTLRDELQPKNLS